ncbi:MAG: hypothetical protein Q8L26_08695 [Candidatus Omnitrophota bacterium]|nr:hypothetical protein [Candidatus Omnitrophota bacterium]
MSAKKARDLKIQVAEGIKVLEASVTVVKAADNVAEIKAGDSLDQKINTAMPLTPELIENMAKKVKDLLNKQSSAVEASGDSQFEGFIAQGIEAGLIISATTGSAISLNKSFLVGQQSKAIIINNFKDINIYQGNKSYKDQPVITEESIRKITLAQLFKQIENLTLGALGSIIVILVVIITLSFKAGYHYREITQSSTIIKQTPSLEQLNSYQISLLKEIYKYQKITEVNKVIIDRVGFIFDESTKKNTSINVAVNVLGNRADQTRFEELIISIPEVFLKSLTETRWGSPYVLTITEETRKLLDKNL